MSGHQKNLRSEKCSDWLILVFLRKLPFLWKLFTVGACRQPPLFWFRIRKWAQLFVHDGITLFLFVHLLLFFHFQGLSTCYPPFLILDSKMRSIVCTRLYMSSFVYTPLTFLPLLGRPGRDGDMLSPFSEFGFENGLYRLYMIVYVFFRLYTSYFFPLPRGAGDMLSPFSDFGFENRLIRLYFVCTWLYTAFFICTPLTFLPLLGPPGTFLILDSKMSSIVCTSLVQDCIRLFSFVHFLLFFYLFVKRLGTCYPLLFWFWIRKWAQSFVFRYYIIVYIFFCLYFLPFSDYS